MTTTRPSPTSDIKVTWSDGLHRLIWFGGEKYLRRQELRDGQWEEVAGFVSVTGDDDKPLPPADIAAIANEALVDWKPTE